MSSNQGSGRLHTPKGRLKKVLDTQDGVLLRYKDKLVEQEKHQR